jgi:hypothetical protein
MAKAKKPTEKKEESIGSLMKGKTTQKERNLKLKAELIEAGDIEEVPIEKMGSVKERNLYLKAQLEKDGKDI